MGKLVSYYCPELDRFTNSALGRVGEPMATSQRGGACFVDEVRIRQRAVVHIVPF